MPQDHCFDVVSKVNLQELRNALQQAEKEIGTRFDFRGTSASVEFDEAGGTLKVTGDHEAQLNSVVEVVETKLAKRGVPVRAFAWQKSEQLPSGGMKRAATLQQGLSSEKSREVVKVIKDLGVKVQPRIDGDAVRVAGKQLDDLQVVIQRLKSQDFGVPLQFENYR
jgi:uncharacterized protein YajQ (UPF0234 family)